MDLPQTFEKLSDQPTEVDILIVDDVFVKQITVKDRDTFMPQHSHKYDHISFIAAGAVQVWEDGSFLGNFEAPRGITIKAGVKHTFRTLAHNTVILCIHNAARADYMAIEEEHQLVK